MKRIIVYVLLAALLFSLGGCGSRDAVESAPPANTAASVEAPPEGSGSLDAALASYNALSQEDKQRLYEVLEAEHAAAEAVKREKMKADLFCDWVMELDFYDGNPPDSYHGYELTLREDMTYDYGRWSGTWQFSEDGEKIELVNGEDGVIYFILTMLEEDGYTKLLCDGEYLYVRQEDHKEAFDKKYVTVRGSQLAPYLGELQQVGSIPPGVWDGPAGNCYIFDSLAREQGLLFLQGSHLFEMEFTVKQANGFSYTGRLHNPFELQVLSQGYETPTDVYITKGAAYFIRSEYVDQVTVVDGEYRELRMKNGTVFQDYNFLCWDLLPEGTYDDYQY